MVRDMQTLFDMERTGLTKNQWVQRKKAFIRNGLRRSDWYDIMPNNLKIGHLRVRMTIQNTRHEHLIYRVIAVDQKVRKGLRQGQECILVVETQYAGLEWDAKKKYVKEIIDLSSFRLVIQ